MREICSLPFRNVRCIQVNAAHGCALLSSLLNSTSLTIQFYIRAAACPLFFSPKCLWITDSTKKPLHLMSDTYK